MERIFQVYYFKSWTMCNTAAALVPLPSGTRKAIFIRRHKRFSVLCTLNGREVWAHTNNTGAMTGVLRQGAEVLLSPAPGPGRKLPWTLERVKAGKGKSAFWIGVNTQLPNLLLKAAFKAGLLEFARGYTDIRMEANCGSSRLDACITGADRPDLWVESKNVTLVEDDIAAFPDAQTERGLKHLHTLVRIVEQGGRGAMFYLVQRPDGKCFGPADYIDEAYAQLFWEAIKCGVEVYAYRAQFSLVGTSLGAMLPVIKRIYL